MLVDFFRKYLLCVLIFASFLSFSQTKEVWVLPAKGEGIYQLLERNGFEGAEYFSEFCKINSSRLGKNNSLISGKKYLLPERIQNANSKTFPIFGKKHERIEFINNELNGAYFYIVAGHGGPDPGAIGKREGHKMCEDEYAYDISLRLARLLLQHGATVYMITRDENDGIRSEKFLKCDKDEVLWGNKKIPVSQIYRLRQRASVVNSLYAENKKKSSYHRLIVIHVDSRSRSEDTDVFFYHHSRSSKGKKLANTLKQTFGEKYKKHQPGRGYNGFVKSRNGLFMVHATDPPVVYIELGNINHTRDQLRFILESNREALAKWMYEGLTKDFKSK